MRGMILPCAHADGGRRTVRPASSRAWAMSNSTTGMNRIIRDGQCQNTIVETRKKIKRAAYEKAVTETAAGNLRQATDGMTWQEREGE